MGTDTYIRIWRRFNNYTGSKEVINDLREQYRLRNFESDYSSNRENNAEEHMKDMPLLLDTSFKAGEIIQEDAARSAYGNKDEKLHVFLASFFFGRCFSSLREYYNLNTSKISTCTAFISKEDARRILQAIKYLLSGNFSDEVEDLLDNEFIKVLGENYPKWSMRKFKDELRFYVDKNSEDSWSITLGDPEEKRDEVEENSSEEHMLKKLECCLQSALDIETSYNGLDDIVIEICAF